MIEILHMPKTAGSSIRSAVRQNILFRPFVRFNEHNIGINDLPKETKIIVSIIRSPDNWYSSLYRHKMETSQKLQHYKDYPNMVDNSFSHFVDDCIYRKDINKVRKWFKPWSPYQQSALMHNPGKTIYECFMDYYLFNFITYSSINQSTAKLIIYDISEVNEKLPKLIRENIPWRPKLKIKRLNTTQKSLNTIFDKDHPAFHGDQIIYDKAMKLASQ